MSWKDLENAVSTIYKDGLPVRQHWRRGDGQLFGAFSVYEGGSGWPAGMPFG